MDIHELITTLEGTTSNKQLDIEQDKIVSDIEDIYPHKDNELFSSMLFQKGEFRLYESHDSEVDLPSRGFKKTNIQNFVKRFIHPRSPYNGLLLWHGVGVGKTCAAIQVAEQFKTICKQYGKKIWILCPKSVIPGWKNELFNQANKNESTI